MSSPRVLIIGGGVGGLALAQGLRKNGISFTLFERDPSPVSRAQGYRIRIAGAGADSLHDCLDSQTWDLFERTCADIKFGGSRFDAINGEPVPPQGPAGPGGAEAFRGGSGGTSGPGKAASAYTVDRTLLRALLLLGQEPHVKFGKSFERYRLTATGVTAFFSDGTSEDGTLLVGAEGVASPVRKQFLPTQKYVDTGSRVIYGKSPFTPELERRFPAEALKWVTVIQDKQPLTLFLEPIRFPRDASIESQGRLLKTDNYVYWVLGGSTEDFGIPDEEFHTLSHKAAADLTIQLTNHWDPAFRSMLELQSVDQCAPLRLISAKPKRPDWTPSARVTLLGDAVHAMMPAGGSGANTALADAALLVRLIVEEGITEDMMCKYIDQMWEYALASIERSALGGQKLLGFKGFDDAKEVNL